MDGFRRIPALSFSATEIMALVLGRDLLKPLEGTQLTAAVDSALAKVTSALPPSGLDFARRMGEFFSIGLGPHKVYARHREVLERLDRAVAERRTVQVRYYSASRGRVTRREVDPYHLRRRRRGPIEARSNSAGLIASLWFPRRRRRGPIEACLFFPALRWSEWVISPDVAKAAPRLAHRDLAACCRRSDRPTYP
jgi:hypothetical protein